MEKKGLKLLVFCISVMLFLLFVPLFATADACYDPGYGACRDITSDICTNPAVGGTFYSGSTVASQPACGLTGCCCYGAGSRSSSPMTAVGGANLCNSVTNPDTYPSATFLQIANLGYNQEGAAATTCDTICTDYDRTQIVPPTGDVNSGGGSTGTNPDTNPVVTNPPGDSTGVLPPTVAPTTDCSATISGSVSAPLGLPQYLQIYSTNSTSTSWSIVNADGTFTILNVCAGTNTIATLDSTHKYASASTTRTVTQGSAPITGVTLNLVPLRLGVITGTVVTAGTTATSAAVAVPSAFVSVKGTNYRNTTLSNGAFTIYIPNVNEGSQNFELLITVSSGDYLFSSTPVTLSNPLYSAQVAITLSKETCAGTAIPERITSVNTKGKPEVTIGWQMPSCKDRVINYVVYRCKDVASKCVGDGNYTPIGFSSPTLPLFYVDSLDWNQNYTYRVGAMFTGSIINISADSAASSNNGPGKKEVYSGDIKCADVMTTAGFCGSIVKTQLPLSYLEAKQYCDASNVYSNISCTGSTPLCAYTGPVDEPRVATCVAPSLCSRSTYSNPFGLYYNYSSCSVQGETCYFDAKTSNVDACLTCKVGMTCSDYSSKSACTNDVNTCGVGNCQWNEIDSALGIGVCASTKTASCSDCSDPTKSAFGVCDASTCFAYGTSTNGCFFKQTLSLVGTTIVTTPSCQSCSATECGDYNTSTSCESSGSGTSRSSTRLNVATNAFLSTSHDSCNINVCRWISQPGVGGGDGTCVKDADANGADANGVTLPEVDADSVNDCNSKAGTAAYLPCVLDRMPPVTFVVMPEMSNPFLSNVTIRFIAQDEGASGANQVLSTRVCFSSEENSLTECNDASQFAKVKVDPTGLGFIVNITGGDIYLPADPVRNSPYSFAAIKNHQEDGGVYYLKYYSIDNSLNREIVKTKKFIINTTKPEVNLSISQIVVTPTPPNFPTLTDVVATTESSVAVKCQLTWVDDTATVTYAPDVFTSSTPKDYSLKHQILFSSKSDGVHAVKSVCRDIMGNTNVNVSYFVNFADPRARNFKPAGTIGANNPVFSIETKSPVICKMTNDSTKLGNSSGIVAQFNSYEYTLSRSTYTFGGWYNHTKQLDAPFADGTYTYYALCNFNQYSDEMTTFTVSNQSSGFRFVSSDNDYKTPFDFNGWYQNPALHVTCTPNGGTVNTCTSIEYCKIPNSFVTTASPRCVPNTVLPVAATATHVNIPINTVNDRSTVVCARSVEQVGSLTRRGETVCGTVLIDAINPTLIMGTLPTVTGSKTISVSGSVYDPVVFNSPIFSSVPTTAGSATKTFFDGNVVASNLYINGTFKLISNGEQRSYLDIILRNATTSAVTVRIDMRNMSPVKTTVQVINSSGVSLLNEPVTVPAPSATIANWSITLNNSKLNVTINGVSVLVDNLPYVKETSAGPIVFVAHNIDAGSGGIPQITNTAASFVDLDLSEKYPSTLNVDVGAGMDSRSSSTNVASMYSFVNKAVSIIADNDNADHQDDSFDLNIYVQDQSGRVSGEKKGSVLFSTSGPIISGISFVPENLSQTDTSYIEYGQNATAKISVSSHYNLVSAKINVLGSEQEVSTPDVVGLKGRFNVMGLPTGLLDVTVSVADEIGTSTNTFGQTLWIKNMLNPDENILLPDNISTNETRPTLTFPVVLDQSIIACNASYRTAAGNIKVDNFVGQDTGGDMDTETLTLSQPLASTPGDMVETQVTVGCHRVNAPTIKWFHVIRITVDLRPPIIAASLQTVDTDALISYDRTIKNYFSLATGLRTVRLSADEPVVCRIGSTDSTSQPQNSLNFYNSLGSDILVDGGRNFSKTITAQITVPSQSAGIYTYAISCVDVAGNLAAVTKFITIDTKLADQPHVGGDVSTDTTAPIVTVSPALTPIIYTQTPTVSFSVTTSEATIVRVSDDVGVIFEQQISGGSSPSSVEIPVPVGVTDAKITFVDLAGNVATSTDVSYPYITQLRRAAIGYQSHFVDLLPYSTRSSIPNNVVRVALSPASASHVPAQLNSTTIISAKLYSNGSTVARVIEPSSIHLSPTSTVTNANISFTLPSPLASGTYMFTYTVSANNSIVASDSAVFTIDTLAESINTIADFNVTQRNRQPVGVDLLVPYQNLIVYDNSSWNSELGVITRFYQHAYNYTLLVPVAPKPTSLFNYNVTNDLNHVAKVVAKVNHDNVDPQVSVTVGALDTTIHSTPTSTSPVPQFSLEFSEPSRLVLAQIKNSTTTIPVVILDSADQQFYDTLQLRSASRLANGAYKLYMTFVDSAGSDATDQFVNFDINAGPLGISLISPQFGLTSGSSMDLVIGTDRPATCKYAAVGSGAESDYSKMNLLTAADTYSQRHTVTIPFTSNIDYTADYIVSCVEKETTTPIVSKTFKLGKSTTTPKINSLIIPTANANLVVSHPQGIATLVVTTDIPTVCRYSSTSGVSYSAMTPFTNSLQLSTSNSQLIDGLADKTRYTYTVICDNGAGRFSDSKSITFSVDMSLTGLITISSPLDRGFFQSTSVPIQFSLARDAEQNCSYSNTSAGLSSAPKINPVSGNRQSYSVSANAVLTSGIFHTGENTLYVRCFFSNVGGEIKPEDTSVSFAIDTTAPTGWVSVPETSGLTLIAPSLKFTDAESNILRYEYAIGTGQDISSCTRSVCAWNNTATGISYPNSDSDSSSDVVVPNLILDLNKQYYVYARALNKAGQYSSPWLSNSTTASTEIKGIVSVENESNTRQIDATFDFKDGQTQIINLEFAVGTSPYYSNCFGNACTWNNTVNNTKKSDGLALSLPNLNLADGTLYYINARSVNDNGPTSDWFYNSTRASNKVLSIAMVSPPLGVTSSDAPLFAINTSHPALCNYTIARPNFLVYSDSDMTAFTYTNTTLHSSTLNSFKDIANDYATEYTVACKKLNEAGSIKYVNFTILKSNTPPVISYLNMTPSVGKVVSTLGGSAKLVATTQNNARCYYKTTPNDATYSLFASDAKTNGLDKIGVSHEQVINGLVVGNAYSYIVYCDNGLADVVSDPKQLDFTVATSNSGLVQFVSPDANKVYSSQSVWINVTTLYPALNNNCKFGFSASTITNVFNSITATSDGGQLFKNLSTPPLGATTVYVQCHFLDAGGSSELPPPTVQRTFSVDITPPTGWVSVPLRSDLTNIAASLKFEDDGSNILKYEYAIGTAQDISSCTRGACGWNNTATGISYPNSISDSSSQIVVRNLNLELNKQYYVYARALNEAGQYSTPWSSNSTTASTAIKGIVSVVNESNTHQIDVKFDFKDGQTPVYVLEYAVGTSNYSSTCFGNTCTWNNTVGNAIYSDDSGNMLSLPNLNLADGTLYYINARSVNDNGPTSDWFYNSTRASNKVLSIAMVSPPLGVTSSDAPLFAINTSHPALCNYTIARPNFLVYSDSDMTAFTYTNTTLHSSTLDSFKDIANDYTTEYTVACKKLNEAGSIKYVNFTILKSNTPPVISYLNMTPSVGKVVSTLGGSAKLVATTQNNARCYYKTTPTGTYSSFSSDAKTNDLSKFGTNHEQVITGLADGSDYSYTVVCDNGLADVVSDPKQLDFTVNASSDGLILFASPEANKFYSSQSVWLNVTTLYPALNNNCKFGFSASTITNVFNSITATADGGQSFRNVTNAAVGANTVYVQCHFLNAGGSSESTPIVSRSFKVDTTAPVGYVNIDNDFSLTQLDAYFNFTDAESGIDYYEYAVGVQKNPTAEWNTTVKTTRVKPSELSNSYLSLDSLNLSPDKTYSVNVRAVNNAGLSTAWMSNSSNASSSVIGAVLIAPESSTKRLDANLSFTGSKTGIDRYEYAVGTTQYSPSIANTTWKNVIGPFSLDGDSDGVLTLTNSTNLPTLLDNKLYYITARIIDGNGQPSRWVSSNATHTNASILSISLTVPRYGVAINNSPAFTVSTNHPATCQYGFGGDDIPVSLVPVNSDHILHTPEKLTVNLSGVGQGDSVLYFVSCKLDSDPTIVSGEWFKITKDSIAPGINSMKVNPSVGSTVVSNNGKATLVVNTSKPAYCLLYNITQLPYTQNDNDAVVFSGDSFSSYHEQQLTNLVNGANYTYGVVCDNGGGVRSDIRIISFTVDSNYPGDVQILTPKADTTYGMLNLNLSVRVVRPAQSCTWSKTGLTTNQNQFTLLSTDNLTYSSPLVAVLGWQSVYVKCVFAASSGPQTLNATNRFSVDNSAPLGGSVTIPKVTRSLDTISGVQLDFSDNESSINLYEYAVGTSQNPASGWNSIRAESNTSDSTPTISDLELDNGTSYYVSARARNAIGLYSPWVSSNATIVNYSSAQGCVIVGNQRVCGSQPVIPTTTVLLPTGTSMLYPSGTQIILDDGTKIIVPNTILSQIRNGTTVTLPLGTILVSPNGARTNVPVGSKLTLPATVVTAVVVTNPGSTVNNTYGGASGAGNGGGVNNGGGVKKTNTTGGNPTPPLDYPSAFGAGLLLFLLALGLVGGGAGYYFYARKQQRRVSSPSVGNSAYGADRYGSNAVDDVVVAHSGPLTLNDKLRLALQSRIRRQKGDALPSKTTRLFNAFDKDASTSSRLASSSSTMDNIKNKLSAFTPRIGVTKENNYPSATSSTGASNDIDQTLKRTQASLEKLKNIASTHSSTSTKSGSALSKLRAFRKK